MFAHISPLGCAVGSGSTAMWKIFGISADRFLPSIRYVMGTFFTPRFLPISGASCAIGPPAAPLKIAPNGNCSSRNNHPKAATELGLPSHSPVAVLTHIGTKISTA
jgi:hypothetical protein